MKKGQKCDVKPGPFLPFVATNDVLLCWFTSTVSGTLGFLKKIFLSLKHPYRAVIGRFLPNFRVSTNFFSIHFRTSERVIGQLLRNFRASAKNFFKTRSRSSEWVIGRLARNFRAAAKKKFENFSMAPARCKNDNVHPSRRR